VQEGAHPLSVAELGSGPGTATPSATTLPVSQLPVT